MTQKEIQERERHWWIELVELAADNNLIEFYKSYAEYLEWAGIVSNSRKTLHKMALAVVSRLEKDT